MILHSERYKLDATVDGDHVLLFCEDCGEVIGEFSSRCERPLLSTVVLMAAGHDAGVHDADS